MASARKRGHTQTVSEECPVCLDAFGSGPHTKVCSFACGDAPHAVCRKCDRTMFMRNDDRCPICRAARSTSSIASGGGRPAPPVPDLDLPLPVIFSPLAAEIQEGAPADFFHRDMRERLSLWLPRRVVAQQQSRWTAPGAASHGAGGYGGLSARRFVLDMSDHPAVAAVIDHVAGADDDAVDADEVPDTSGDAFLASMLSDHGIAAALDGLAQMGGHRSARGWPPVPARPARRRGGATGTV